MTERDNLSRKPDARTTARDQVLAVAAFCGLSDKTIVFTVEEEAINIIAVEKDPYNAIKAAEKIGVSRNQLYLDIPKIETPKTGLGMRLRAGAGKLLRR